MSHRINQGFSILHSNHKNKITMSFSHSKILKLKLLITLKQPVRKLGHSFYLKAIRSSKLKNQARTKLKCNQMLQCNPSKIKKLNKNELICTVKKINS